MRMNMQSPWFSGCLAAVTIAVIWLVTCGGLGGGLFHATDAARAGSQGVGRAGVAGMAQAARPPARVLFAHTHVIWQP